MRARSEILVIDERIEVVCERKRNKGEERRLGWLVEEKRGRLTRLDLCVLV